MDKLRDGHYFQISSQGNIYTLTNLQLANGTNKILVASLKREVYIFEYPENSSDILIPTTKEVLFTYIPGRKYPIFRLYLTNGDFFRLGVVEIISIDAFNKSNTENDFVIGITITKGGNEQSRENYLNIYSAWESTTDFNIESISQNCLNVELSFIPYQLYHTSLQTWDENNIIKNEIVWLLSGSDEKIHVYREYSVSHCYKEIELKDCFPEFSNPPSIVLWMDVQYYENYQKRISAYGCECGYVNLAIVCTKNLQILNSFSTRYENAIATINIFKVKNIIATPTGKSIPKECFNLLVSNTVLPSVVFINITEKGFSEFQLLEGSDYFNVTNCTSIADIDLDGENEILIGKYGQEILAYKCNEIGEWILNGIKSFANPVFAMLHVDVTGDGVKELIVLTLRGVQILQHDPKYVQEKLNEKLKKLKFKN